MSEEKVIREYLRKKEVLPTSLVKASIKCMDYVIMHELCHLKIHTHDNGYFKLLSKHMPDWKRGKRGLREFLYRKNREERQHV